MSPYLHPQYLEDVHSVCALPLDWSAFEGKTVAVSGATGLIGSCLIDTLLLACPSVRIIAISRNGSKAVERFSHNSGGRVEVLAHDVNLPFPETADADYVIHLASCTHPLAYATSPIETIMTNIEGTRNMLELARRKEGCRFVFTSSNEIYGTNREGSGTFSEDYCGYIDCNSLRAGYPESKRCGEALCQAYMRQYGVDVVIPRVTRCFGPTLLPDDSKALSQFLHNAVRSEDIVLKSKGDQYFSYIYVVDAVSAILTIMLKGESGVAYNIACPDCDITLRRLAETLAEIAGTKVVFDLPSETEAAGFSKATVARLNPSRLNTLGWKAAFNIKTALMHTISCVKCILILLCVHAITSCSNVRERYEPQSLEELYGHKLGLLEGSVQASYAEANLKDKGVELMYFPSIPDGLMGVRQGAADVFFGNPLATFNEAFKSQHMKICLTVKEIEAKTAFGLKKGNDGLRHELDAYIDSLKSSGELDEILSRWLSPDNTDFHDTYRLDPIPSNPTGNGKVLKIGISENNPPATVMVDNKWTGYEIEILQRFAGENGYQLKVTSYTFNNLIPAVNSGLEDIIASTLILTDERKQKIDFSHVTVDLHTALIVADPDYKPTGSIWQKIKSSAYASLIKENRWKLIVEGFKSTLIIALSSLVLGALFGCLVCSFRMSRRKWKSALAKAYIYIMRNIPILVFIMIMFYVVFAGSVLSPISVAIIAFSLNSAAFIAEIYRAGIQSVDYGQKEAAIALGFTNLRAFFNIVVPQAAKTSLPVMTNECITLLKGTSIVGYISIIDLTKASDLIRSSSFEAFFPLLLITVIYFILASLITFVLEKTVSRI